MCWKTTDGGLIIIDGNKEFIIRCKVSDIAGFDIIEQQIKS